MKANDQSFVRESELIIFPTFFSFIFNSSSELQFDHIFALNYRHF